MNLIWLLMGPGDLRRSWWLLLGVGLLLFATGLLVMGNTSAAVTELALEGCGYVMVALGLFKIAFAIVGMGEGMPATFAARGLVYVILGLAIADFPDASDHAVPWLFGVALLVNGLYQLASSLVIRYPHWRWFVFSGVMHILVSAAMFLFWRQAMHSLIPLFLGGGLIVLGYSSFQLGRRLRQFTRDSGGMGPAELVRYFLQFHLPGRFRRADYPDPAPPPETGRPHGNLQIHIWTPTAVARLDNPDPNVVNRYLVAQDKEGKITVGHAALELDPDIYLSHCDGDPTGYDGTEEAFRELRSKDGHGVFLPTFEEEIEHYLLPSVTLRFRNFKEDQVRTFWAMYRQVTTYNLTNRNCSVAVALALESALMGSMGGSSRIKSMANLLMSRDVWVAHFLRWKAREMVWTPGMMLDYAMALHRIVEA